MRILLTVAFCFSLLMLQAQNLTAIDSLKQQLTSADAKDEYELLNAIGFEYRYSFPDSTIYYCTKAYKLGQDLKLKKDLSRPLSFIGLASAYRGHYKAALEYHEKAITVAIDQQDSTQLAYGYNNLGRMFIDRGDVVRAYQNFNKALGIFSHINDKVGLAYVYRSLVSLYKIQNDYSKALTNSLRALDLRRKIGEPRAVISALFELALVYQGINEKEAALKYFREADSIASQVDDHVTIAEIRTGMAEIFFNDGKLDRSLALANDVLKVVSEKTNQNLFFRATLIRAKYAYQKKQDERATALFTQILTFSEASENLSFQREALFFLADIFKRNNNPVAATGYTQRYNVIQAKLQTEDLTKEIERLQFRLEIEKKEKENELLKAEDAKNLALISKQRLLNVGLVGSIVLLGVIAGVTLISSNKRRKINSKLALQNQHIAEQRAEIAQQNEKLYRRNQELADINREKDTLMSIVAHDLKSPMNRIFGLANLMEAERNMNNSQEEYLKLLKDAIRSGLDLITDLLDVNSLKEVKDRPSYGTIKIDELITGRVKSFQQIAELKSITLIVNSDFSKPIISERNYITRILDNLISNAIKFSSFGTQVSLTITCTGEKLILAVKDQGPGFSYEDRTMMYQKFKKLSARPTAGESSNGLGLAIVKILVDRLRGDITLVSEPGNGSEFIVQIPISVVENVPV
jgi:signal transduction histidine kinase